MTDPHATKTDWGRIALWIWLVGIVVLVCMGLVFEFEQQTLWRGMT